MRLLSNTMITLSWYESKGKIQKPAPDLPASGTARSIQFPTSSGPGHSNSHTNTRVPDLCHPNTRVPDLCHTWAPRNDELTFFIVCGIFIYPVSYFRGKENPANGQEEKKADQVQTESEEKKENGKIAQKGPETERVLC